jgi:hypothetical protein
MDNSMSHSRSKVIDELEVMRLDRVPHPLNEPDLISSDFWLFGMLKQNIVDRVFQTIEEILDAFRHV